MRVETSLSFLSLINTARQRKVIDKVRGTYLYMLGVYEMVVTSLTFNKELSLQAVHIVKIKKLLCALHEKFLIIFIPVLFKSTLILNFILGLLDVRVFLCVFLKIGDLSFRT